MVIWAGGWQAVGVVISGQIIWKDKSNRLYFNRLYVQYERSIKDDTNFLYLGEIDLLFTEMIICVREDGYQRLSSGYIKFQILNENQSGNECKIGSVMIYGVKFMEISKLDIIWK